MSCLIHLCLKYKSYINSLQTEVFIENAYLLNEIFQKILSLKFSPYRVFDST